MQPPYPDLPPDDQLAFLQLEREFRQTLDDDVRRDGRDPALAQLAYVNKVLAAADALGIEALTPLTKPAQPIEKTAANVHHLRDEIDQVLVGLRIQMARHTPTPAAQLAEDQQFRLGALLSSIASEIGNAPIDRDCQDEALAAVTSLRRELEAGTLRMEHFVDLGRAIAGIGRIQAAEAEADKCWRWFRVAMGLVSQSPRPHRPFAHLDTHQPDGAAPERQTDTAG